MGSVRKWFLIPFWRLIIKFRKSNEERNILRWTLESFSGRMSSGKLELYVSQREHGVIICTGIIMNFVCGTVGVPDSVKGIRRLTPMTSLRPTLSHCFILKKNRWTNICLLPGYYPFSYIWSKAWLEIKRVSRNTLMKWFGKGSDLNSFIERRWTVQKRTIFYYIYSFET